MKCRARKTLLVAGVVLLALLILLALARGSPYRTALRLRHWWETRRYYKRAIPELERQVAENPQDVAPRIYLAKSLAMTGKPQQAFEAAKAAYGLEPGSAGLWSDLAAVFIGLKQRGGLFLDDEDLHACMIGCADRLRAAALVEAPGDAVPQGQAAFRVRFLIDAGHCYVLAGERRTASAVYEEAMAVGERIAADPDEPSRGTAAILVREVRLNKDAWLRGP